MLVLSRKRRQSVVVGGHTPGVPMVKITVLAISGTTVQLGFEAEQDIAVHRLEVWEDIHGIDTGDTKNETPTPTQNPF